MTRSLNIWIVILATLITYFSKGCKRLIAGGRNIVNRHAAIRVACAAVHSLRDLGMVSFRLDSDCKGNDVPG